MNLYRHADWLRFRSEVIKLHGGCCARCLRSSDADAVVLQVHHIAYLPGRKPWEYGHTECEALCKGCHAVEHGLIMPQSGWQLLGSDDLGDLVGNCELCSTELRYVYAIYHDAWGAMAVGIDCCDRLTETTAASEHHARYTKSVDMRKRFVKSKRWKIDHFGNHCIRQKRIDVRIVKLGDQYAILMNDMTGRERFASILDAKIKAFDSIDTGKAIEYFSRLRERRNRELSEALGFRRQTSSGDRYARGLSSDPRLRGSS